jgi:hypothetical protein
MTTKEGIKWTIRPPKGDKNGFIEESNLENGRKPCLTIP